MSHVICHASCAKRLSGTMVSHMCNFKLCIDVFDVIYFFGRMGVWFILFVPSPSFWTMQNGAFLSDDKICTDTHLRVPTI